MVKVSPKKYNHNYSSGGTGNSSNCTVSTMALNTTATAAATATATATAAAAAATTTTTKLVESSRVFLPRTKFIALCLSNLAGIRKLNYERKTPIFRRLLFLVP